MKKITSDKYRIKNYWMINKVCCLGGIADSLGFIRTSKMRLKDRKLLKEAIENIKTQSRFIENEWKYKGAGK